MQPGDVIDAKYRIEECLGEGATSIVYKAQDDDLGQPVVIKMLRPELLAVPAHRERFVREASIAAYFVSQYAVAVRDIAAWDNTMYLVLDYHPGNTLDLTLHSRRLTTAQISTWGEELLLCLCDAHRQGIRHGDIKPANLLLSENQNGTLSLRLLDFGLASLRGEKRQDSGAGTLIYLAPEQILRDQADLRSDLYAAAACIYHMITGAPPLQAESPEKWAYQVTCQKPAAPSQYCTQLPRNVDKVILKALAVAPEDRYQSAREFLIAWQQAWQRHRHWSRRLTIAMAVTLLLAGVGYYWTDRHRQYQHSRLLLADARSALAQQEYEPAERLARQVASRFPREATDILRQTAVLRLASLPPEQIPLWLDSQSDWANQAEDAWLRAYVSFCYTTWQMDELAQKGEYGKAAEWAQQYDQAASTRLLLQGQAARLRLTPAIVGLLQALQRQDVLMARRHLKSLDAILDNEAKQRLQRMLSEMEVVVGYETCMRQNQFREALAACQPMLHMPAWQQRMVTAKTQMQEWLRAQSVIVYPTPGMLLRQNKITVRGLQPPPDYVARLTLQGMPVVPTPEREWQMACELVEGKQELVLAYRDAVCDFELARLAVSVDTTSPRITVERVALAADGGTWLFTGRVDDCSGVTVETLGKPFFRADTPQSQTWSYTIAASSAPSRLVFIARDDAGNSGEYGIELPQDTTPPVLTLESPAPDTWCYSPRITVRGQVEDASGIASLTVAGQSVAVAETGLADWQAEVELPFQAQRSENCTLSVEAIDRAGNKSRLLLPLRCRYRYWQSLPVLLAMRLHGEKIWGLAFSPQGDFVVCAGNDQKIQVVWTGSWQIARTCEGSFATSYDFGITPAIFFASGIMEQMTNSTKDKFWQHMEAGGMWQVSAAALQQSPYRFISEFCQPQVRQLAVSPDFSRFAVGDRNGYLKLVVRKEPPEIWNYKAHQGGVLALCFSASGRWLASGGGDNLVKVWDAHTGQCCMSLEGHTMPVTALAFGEQEQILASGSRDKKICLWSLRDGTLIANKSGNTSSVTAISFDPQGQTLVSGNYNGELMVWGKTKE